MARDVDLEALATGLRKTGMNGGVEKLEEQTDATSSRPGYDAVRRKMLF